VALTWAILATSVVPRPLPFRLLAKAGRDLLVDAFLAALKEMIASATVTAT
jgi:hypothetical protein